MTLALERERWQDYLMPAYALTIFTGAFLLFQVQPLIGKYILPSTGPLMQLWFSVTHTGASPCRLYSLSNAGSLLALVSYPFYFETHFTRRTQAALWGWGVAVYAVGCALCGLKFWNAARAECPRGQ